MNIQLANLLEIYSSSHQNKMNQKIHKVAVPLIVLCLLGILSEIKWGPLNLGWITVFVSVFYYLRFRNLKVFLIIYLQVLFMMIFIFLNPYSSLLFYSILFVLAWVAQFIGHKIEGKKPSFLQDIQFLMIGPIWVLRNFLN